MNYSEIFSEIDKIRSILKRWESGNSVDAIERDLILDKLKKLYESVLFADGVAPTEEPAEEPLPKVAFAPIDLSIDLFEPKEVEQVEVAVDVAAEVEVETAEVDVDEAETKVVTEAAVDLDEAEANFEIELEAEAEIAEVEEERLEEEETEVTQIEVTADDEAEVAETEVVAVHISDQRLFGEDAMPVKRTIDRRVILSLYGDDPIEGIASVEKEVEQMDVQSTTEAFPTIESTLNEPTIKHAPGAILGEVMGQDHHTFGEVMSAVQDKKDIATKVASANTTSLRKIIGINDKFLMIRDIFGGDAAAYEQTISTLETFNNLDNALIHIHESYDWNSNSEGVKLLIELLTRKLS